MPDIAKVLREEIQRLARKEVKGAIGGLRKESVTLKRSVAEHKRRIAKLEQDNRKLLAKAARRQAEVLEVTGDEVEKARITAKTITGIRAKLGLSQAELAKLLGVNSQTVYQWEHKEGRLDFRGDAKARIIEVRKLGARQARERLLQIKAVPKRKTRRQKKKGR